MLLICWGQVPHLVLSPLIRFLWESREHEEMTRPMSQTLCIEPYHLFLQLSFLYLSCLVKNVLCDHTCFVYPTCHQHQDSITEHFPTERVGRHMTHDQVLTISIYCPHSFLIWLLCDSEFEYCDHVNWSVLDQSSAAFRVLSPTKATRTGDARKLIFSYLLQLDWVIIGK